MDPMFMFSVIDKTKLSIENQSNEKTDVLYAHPSSNDLLIRGRGAYITLWDISKSADRQNTNGESPSCKSLRMMVGVALVEISVVDLVEEDLLLLFGGSVTEVNNVGHYGYFLRIIEQVLGFICKDLRRKITGVEFRSDLDGLVVYALHISGGSAWQESAGLSFCYPKEPEMELLEKVVTVFEAGEILRQTDIEREYEPYVIGSCLFIGETLVVDHLYPELSASVNNFMKFHRKGFRSVKNDQGFFYGEVSLPKFDLESDMEISYYLLWSSLDGMTLCTCVELFHTSDADFGNIMECLNFSMVSALEEVSLKTAARSIQRKHKSSIDMIFPVDRTDNLKLLRGLHFAGKGTLTRTVSVPNVPQKFALQPDRHSLHTVPSGPMAQFSMSTENLSHAYRDIPGQMLPDKKRSSLIFCLHVLLENKLASFQSSVSDYSRNSLLPPSLFDDFVSYVPHLRLLFQDCGDQPIEITFVLEYPSPSLVRRYWISGLTNPSREVFYCYPEGFEALALFESLKL